MNKDDKRLRLTECPVCHGHLKITTVKCDDCGLELKNDFDLSIFDRLNNDDYEFLIAFLKNKGNLKSLQAEMGISYPFAKKKLDNLLYNLKLESNITDEGEIDMNNIATNYNSTRASEILRCKLIENGGTAKFNTFEGKTHYIKLCADGIRFTCDALPTAADFTLNIFDVVVDFLISQGGRARKGNAQGYRIGDPNCDSSTVAGTIGKQYFHKTDGETCLNPVFIISAILDWAGIADNRRGYLELTHEFKAKIYL